MVGFCANKEDLIGYKYKGSQQLDPKNAVLEPGKFSKCLIGLRLCTQGGNNWATKSKSKTLDKDLWSKTQITMSKLTMLT